MKEKSWYVYIIETDKGHLYTGITTDVDRRFKEHCSSPKGAKYFRGAMPLDVVFTKTFPNRSEASKFEAKVKTLTRPQKLKLIKSGSLSL